MDIIAKSLPFLPGLRGIHPLVVFALHVRNLVRVAFEPVPPAFEDRIVKVLILHNATRGSRALYDRVIVDIQALHKIWPTGSVAGATIPLNCGNSIHAVPDRVTVKLD